MSTDDEMLEALHLVSLAILELEDSGGTASHMVIPNDLEIQSLVMFVCDRHGLTYEVSAKANEMYCT